jgi:hypothetical protein
MGRRYATAGFSPTSAQSAAFLARATNVTSTTDKTNYDTMITGLVNDGVWAKMDALYIWAAVDQTTALLNLVSSSFPGVTTGTVNFSAYHGYTGDGSTFAVDTGFVPSAGGTNYTLNSASMSVYNQTLDASENARIMGCSITTYLYFQPLFGNVFKMELNAPGAELILGGFDQRGLWISSQNATTGGISLDGGAQSTAAFTPTSLSGNQVRIWGEQSTGNFSADQFSASHIGGYFSDTDCANFSNRINTYMTAYGINLYP